MYILDRINLEKIKVLYINGNLHKCKIVKPYFRTDIMIYQLDLGLRVPSLLTGLMFHLC